MNVIELLFLLLSIVMPPCEYEDSTNCYWDASSRGNGEGTSFVIIENLKITKTSITITN